MTEQLTRGLLIDDHALFRESVSLALSEPWLEIEHCADIREGVRLLRERPFDIVLLDYELGNERATVFFPAAREAGLNVRVLVVAAWISQSEARRLLRQGASGIFLKQAPIGELKEAIRTTLAGRMYLDQSFARLSDDVSQPNEKAYRFNERQQRVLQFVVEGLSNKEIAWRLQISESYVKSILQSLFKITGVRTRGQLVRLAFEQYGAEL